MEPTINSFSFNNLLSAVSDAYTLPIQQAIKSVAPMQNVNTIQFEQLLGGISNAKLFKFCVNNTKYVLRLLDEMEPIKKRQSELRTHQIGASLSIAPKLFYSDQAPLVLVIEYIEGRALTRQDLDNPDIIKKIMQTIKKLHHHQTTKGVLHKTHIELIRELYERNITQNGIIYPTCFEPLLRNLEKEFTYLNTNKVPSHGDLHPDNILIADNGEIYLIDWAEASTDDPFFDIGWFACCSAASTNQIPKLLQAYLGRCPDKSEINKTLFFRNMTMFYIANFMMDKQSERNQNKLDTILNLPLKKSTAQIIEGVTKKDISQKNGLDLTIHTLEWLKEFIESQTENSLQCFLLIIGVSGAGKTTIIQHLKKIDRRIVPITPYTTRPPRPYEVDKIIISPQEMEQLEHQQRNFIFDKTNRATYATSLDDIEAALHNGQIPVLDCPLNRLNIMRNIFGKKLFCVYVAPPSLNTLLKRLATDKRDQDGIRLQAAQDELVMFSQGAFDHLVDKFIINHDGKAECYAREILEEINLWQAKKTSSHN